MATGGLEGFIRVDNPSELPGKIKRKQLDPHEQDANRPGKRVAGGMEGQGFSGGIDSYTKFGPKPYASNYSKVVRDMDKYAGDFVKKNLVSGGFRFPRPTGLESAMPSGTSIAWMESNTLGGGSSSRIDSPLSVDIPIQAKQTTGSRIKVSADEMRDYLTTVLPLFSVIRSDRKIPELEFTRIMNLADVHSVLYKCNDRYKDAELISQEFNFLGYLNHVFKYRSEDFLVSLVRKGDVPFPRPNLWCCTRSDHLNATYVFLALVRRHKCLDKLEESCLQNSGNEIDSIEKIQRICEYDEKKIENGWYWRFEPVSSPFRHGIPKSVYSGIGWQGKLFFIGRIKHVEMKGRDKQAFIQPLLGTLWQENYQTRTSSKDIQRSNYQPDIVNTSSARLPSCMITLC